MNPILLLEQYHVTKLHVDWSFPSGEKQIVVEEVDFAFNYDIGAITSDPNRRRMRFQFDVQERDAKKQKVAHHVVCELLAVFSFTDATPKGKEELILRINGVSQLYSTMRGIISTVTGVFPGGRFDLPSITPQEIVKEIEARKAQAARQQELVKA